MRLTQVTLLLGVSMGCHSPSLLGVSTFVGPNAEIKGLVSKEPLGLGFVTPKWEV